MWFSFLFLAVTSSIDAFGIGIVYAIKGVKIPFKAKAFVGFLSAAILWGAALIGEVMMKFLPEWSVKYLGVFILVFMGIVFIRNAIRDQGNTYDLDSSKTIEGIETILLAIALSADSVSVGMAAVTFGFSWFWLGFLVGVIQMLFLLLGEVSVCKNNKLCKISNKSSGIFSGMMLIVIGIIRILL